MAEEGSKKKTGKSKELEVIDPIYEKYVKGVIRTLGSTQFYEYFMDSVMRADNEFQFSNRRVEKFVDTSWIDAIEDALEGFQSIINSPRNVIKEEELIVNVANAKKAGSDVVRHLATHAALVDSYNEQTSEVRPGRLMQKYRDDTMGIYENRLVFTTLEKAYHFVKIRYDALFEAMGDEFGAKLKLRSDMSSATELVHLDMFLHIKDADGVLEVDEKNRETFDRISRLFRILSMNMNSRFAIHMARRQRVSGAIMKTNILKKNPDYRQIVKLFEFLNKYDDIGYTIKIIEQNPVINEDFERDIYHNIMFNYLVLKGHLERDKERMLPEPLKQKKRSMKPKFIKEIIEELTEDYDLPDVEIRKVLIEELTKEQLMLEEEAERRRLVEEQEQRKREEEERRKREEEEELERQRLLKEAEEERIRKEKEAELARLKLERMEREQEMRRRSNIFRKEIEYFLKNLTDRLEMRRELEEELAGREAAQDFEDAALIMEETERLKREEIKRARQRAREEMERKLREEELERQRIEQEQMMLAEKLRVEQYEKDMETVSPLQEELKSFTANIGKRMEIRKAVAAEEKARREKSKPVSKQAKK